VLTVIALLIAVQLLPVRSGPVPRIGRPVAGETTRDAAIEAIVTKYVAEHGQREAVYYRYNRVDLNSDGVPEILLHVDGRAVCESGGCPLLILRLLDNVYTTISTIALTTRPIVVSENRTGGWNDLILWQRRYGDSDRSQYVVLSNDSGTYPENPSAPPARPLTDRPRGTAYMSDIEQLGIELPIAP
jgi:hypothetical protein